MSKIERSNQPGRFTEAEIRAGLAETKRRQSQPGYAAAEAKRTAEVERRAKGRGTKFPDLAKRGGTKPVLAGITEVRFWADRLGIQATTAEPKPKAHHRPRLGYTQGS